ncbi:hypothetical protein D1007_05080 [Hordeum vulgare]|nr:hypothetical protein D1007_05080 [Hordeum vulgare]
MALTTACSQGSSIALDGIEGPSSPTGPGIEEEALPTGGKLRSALGVALLGLLGASVLESSRIRLVRSSKVCEGSDTPQVKSEVAELRSKYIDHHDKMPINKIEEVMLIDEIEDGFIRSFAFYFISTILCPASYFFGNMKFLYSLRDVSILPTLDFGQLALNFMREESERHFEMIMNRPSVEEMNKPSHIGGCLPIWGEEKNPSPRSTHENFSTGINENMSFIIIDSSSAKDSVKCFQGTPIIIQDVSPTTPVLATKEDRTSSECDASVQIQMLLEFSEEQDFSTINDAKAGSSIRPNTIENKNRKNRAAKVQSRDYPKKLKIS